MSTSEESNQRSGASRREVVGAGVALAAGSLAISTAAIANAAPATCCPIVEMRQYTLRRGQRDAFITLFEREFIESQEAVGIRIIGGFRDLDDPDRYVWLRGFPDMTARAKSLSAFYDGALWKSKRDAANASINDSDNVLLLRPAQPGSGFAAERLRQPPPGHAPERSDGLVVASLHYVEEDQLAPFAGFFEQKMRPRIEALGIPVIAQFATELSANNFPRLTIREKDRVFVWFTHFPSEAERARRFAALHEAQSWREGASDPILHQLERKPEVLRLAPAGRSALRA